MVTPQLQPLVTEINTAIAKFVSTSEETKEDDKSKILTSFCNLKLLGVELDEIVLPKEETELSIELSAINQLLKKFITSYFVRIYSLQSQDRGRGYSWPKDEGKRRLEEQEKTKTDIRSAVEALVNGSVEVNNLEFPQLTTVYPKHPDSVAYTTFSQNPTETRNLYEALEALELGTFAKDLKAIVKGQTYAQLTMRVGYH